MNINQDKHSKDDGQKAKTGDKTMHVMAEDLKTEVNNSQKLQESESSMQNADTQMDKKLSAINTEEVREEILQEDKEERKSKIDEYAKKQS